MAGDIINVGEKDFKAVVLDSPKPVLVDFWAVWCGPCRMVAPIIDELSAEYKEKMGFAKVNVDEAPKIASAYSVMSIPTMIVFKGGKPIEQVVGFRPKKDLQKLLDKALVQ
ncbi:MAG: thioredoxin [Dehalococcoidia bacterium]|nr:thioredoxin [Dehalococcoidia bacterium]MDD5493497.1 thioredoxin [Dehalococcoidia bacterium]